MMMYDKLVRDRIPEIIKASGKACETRILTPEEYRAALDAKLQEELAEYLESKDVEELADLVELIHAIVISKGMALGDLERVRLAKRDARGAFEDRILLLRAE